MGTQGMAPLNSPSHDQIGFFNSYNKVHTFLGCVFFILVRNVKLCTCHCEMFILPAGAGRDGEAGERGRSQLLPDVHGL